MPMGLPDVDLFDASVENSGWRWNEGLNGLVPSRSTIEDAKRLFGEVSGSSELANGMTYDFLNGGIRATVLDNATAIRTIVFLQKPETQAFMPPNIASAMLRFGKLCATKLDRFEGVTYERPGMRIICDPSLSPERVMRIEIFAPVVEQNACQ